jgi:hypothetical protein
MTTQSAAKDRQQSSAPGGKPNLVVVELAKRRTPDQVRRLRKGRGKLVGDIDAALAELVSSGTISADAQPVVVVVREAVLAPLFDLDDEDDEDDDDDED